MTQQFAIINFSELPPSVNNLYAHGMHGRFKTPRYKAWLTLAGHELNRQKPGYVAGHYCMSIEAGAVRKRRDLSNIIKALEDAIVAHGVVDDDSKCRKLTAEWVTRPGVKIMIVSTKLVDEA